MFDATTATTFDLSGVIHGTAGLCKEIGRGRLTLHEADIDFFTLLKLLFSLLAQTSMLLFRLLGMVLLAII